MRAYGPEYGLDRKTIGIAFVVAVAVRMLLLPLVAYQPLAGDGFWYDKLAHTLIDHGVLSLSLEAPFEPSYYRPPLYPYFVSLVYRVWDSPLAVQLVQVFVSAGTAILVALIVERLATRMARATLWLAVLVPANGVFVGTMLSETLATFFLVAALAAPVLSERRAGWWIMGVCLGAAALTRDVYIALIPFFVVLLPFDFVHGWVEQLPLKKRLRSAAMVVLGAMMTIGPWTARNYATFGEFVPVSKGILGQGLWIGAWELDGQWLVDGGFENGPPDGSYRDEAEKAKVEHALSLKDKPRDNAMRELAFDRYREEPLSVFGRWLIRAPRMWIGTRFDLFDFRPSFLARGTAPWWLTKAALFGLHSTIVVLGFLGLFLAVVRRSWMGWLAIPVVYNALIFLPLHSTEPRYSAPVYLFVCAFAAYLAVMAVDRWRMRKR